MDGKRGLFNSELSFQTSENLTENEKTLLEATKYTNTVDKRSSGWLNMSPSYSKTPIFMMLRQEYLYYR